MWRVTRSDPRPGAQSISISEAAALRAYAQPIDSGGKFAPVAGETERRVLKAINSAH